jgi:predicted nucleic acid-binding protein
MTPPLVCVVDASVAIKLYLVEPLSNEANALFACLADPSTVFHVPDLFYAECANILWKQVQRGNGTPAQATAHYAALAQLPLQRTPTADVGADALSLALTHGITA